MPKRSGSAANEVSLAEYRRKRDFARTAEPRGNGGTGRSRRDDAGQYVIQRHHASREHFDLRLEVDGVMKSWAVPRGPSRDPSEKRLAVQVEDHPIDYNTFEGTIPEGEYGAGTVMIWDRGRYVPEGGMDAMRRGLEDGKLSFRLDGERLEGGWTLIRMQGRGRDGRQWLLVKQKDPHAVAPDDLAERDVKSVASGRSMTEVASGARPATRRSHAATPAKSARNVRPGKRAKSSRTEGNGTRGMPSLTPMLATIGTDLPDDSESAWAFEPKYDGVRVLAFVTRDSVALVTRNGREKTVQFPEIVEALERLHARRRRPFVVDGEIVARSGRRLGRFQALQRRIGEQDPETIQEHMKTAPAVLVAFDLLLDGERSLVNEPWTTRRKRLERLLGGKLPRGLRLGQARVGNGARLLTRARELGWEGLIAKRADSAYLPGQRSADWRKLKVEMRQEFVVGGWTDPRRTRPHLGALLLGYWEGNRLRYAGHMGGGFTRQALEEMRVRLEPLAQPQSPFDEEPDTNEPAHWVRPEVVVEVKFNEWTSDGRLRQPIFVGVRDDRNPRTVVREPISMQDDDRDNQTKSVRRTDAQGNGHAAVGSRRGRGRIRRRVQGMKDLDGVFDALLEIEEAGGDGTIEFGRGHELAVSSLDKFYFRDAQRTKGDLMRYYVRAAPWLLPLMADRPLALKRHPEGVQGESFFQQAPPENTPPVVRVERVPTEDGPAPRLIGGDLVTLLYCVQLGSIAVNPWHSRVRTLETPDYSVIDLDPGPRAPFATVVQIARWLHEELEDAGISAAVKSSGSRGLHLVIPLPPRTSAESAQLMAQLFAKRVAATRRKEATTIRSKSQRSQRAVYIDYMQNVVGKTVVAALSVRARPGATVSTPLAWEELTDDLDPTVFTIDTVPDELEARGRMFLDVLHRGNRLERLLASA